jgi:hypothetical protein
MLNRGMVHVDQRNGSCLTEEWFMLNRGMVHVEQRNGSCWTEEWFMLNRGMVHVEPPTMDKQLVNFITCGC